MPHQCWTLAVLTLCAASASGQDKPAEPTVKLVATFAGHENSVSALAFSPDSRRAVSACSRSVRVWDPATGKEIRALKGVGSEVFTFNQVFAIRPDCKQLALAGREKLTIHDLENGKQLLSIDPYGDWDRGFPFRPRVAAAAFSPDGRWLATAASVAKVGGPHGLPGGVVTIWDASSGKAAHQFEGLSTGASSVAFSADGKLVAAGTNGAGGELPEPGELWVWELEKGRTLHKIKSRAEANPGEYISIADVAFSPDGKRLAAAVGAGSRGRPAGLLIDDEPATVRFWDLASGEPTLALAGHTAGVGRVAFSPDGQRFATAGRDQMVRVWNATTGKEVAAIPFKVAMIDAIAFSPDGKRLAAGGGGEKDKPGEIKVWALED